MQKKRLLIYVLLILSGFLGAYLFLRTKPNQSANNTVVTAIKKDSIIYISLLNEFFDFENNDGAFVSADVFSSGSENIKVTKAHSGTRAFDLSGSKEYGPSVTKKLSELGNPFPKKISMSAWIYPLSDNPNTVLTASIVNSKNETVFWEGKSTENKSFPKNKWTKINTSYFLPVEKLSADDVLGVGIWNKGKTDVIIDDLEIVYGESADRRGSASTIDAKAIYEKRFIAVKNKPPFQTIFFDKQEINNGDIFSITPNHKPNGTENFSANDVFLVGDFFPDKYNLEEIICFKEKSRGMFSYSPESKQFIKLWENTATDDPFWNRNSNAYSGDFNTDGKTDVLVVETKTNRWKILNFNGKEWILVSEGKDPKKEWIGNKKTNVAGIINPDDTLFPGNYTEEKQTFLKLNTEWRFDLKLLEKEDSGYRIIGNVDFKGYPKDYNPKYFEFIKLITGKFLSKEKTSVLIVMCNCADANFSGKKCDQIENLPFLPNSVQLYNISPQMTQIFTDKY